MNGERIDCAYHYFIYFISFVCGKCQDIISIIHFKKEERKEGRKVAHWELYRRLFSRRCCFAVAALKFESFPYIYMYTSN